MASSSCLPWLWIIEYLASFKETDVSALTELIKREPELHTESGRKAREMVYLRVLESFLDGQTRNIDKVSCKMRIDPEETCEDVVLRIMEESQSRNEPDILNWDIQSFITYKRAAMPKCTLLKLNDAILRQKHCDHAPMKENSGPYVDGADCAVDVEKIIGSCSAGQPARGNDFTCSDPGTSDSLVPEDLSDKTFLTSKRSRSEGDSEKEIANSSGFSSMNNVHSAKKLGHCGASFKQAISQESVDATGNELLEEDGSDRYIPSKGLRQCNDGGVQFTSSLNICKNDTIPQDVSGDGAHQNIRTDATPGAALTLRISQSSLGEQARGKSDTALHNMHRDPLLDARYRFSDERGEQLKNNPGDELPIDTGSSQDEKIDVAMMKRYFLSSEQAFRNHFSSIADYTIEPDACLMCGKGGQLLICTTTACPLVVHQTCLSFTASFDVSGNFHCPFCAYLKADLGHMEAKKKVFVSQKDLAVFLMLENEDKVNKHSEGLLRQDKVDEHSEGSYHFSDKLKDDMQHVPGGEVPGDSYNNLEENIDVAKMKQSFLISQSAVQLDSFSVVDGTECNLCMKCNIGGHTLVCSANACPMVVHQSCLGYSPRLDDSGNFYCPFCSYHHAIQTHARAKEKVFLTRKNLFSFVWSEKGHLEKGHVYPDRNHSRQNDSVARSDQANVVKKQSEHLVSSANDNSSCGKDATQNDPLHGVPVEDEREDNNIGKECLPLSPLAVQQVRRQVGASDDRSSSRNTELAFASMENSEDRTLQQPIFVLPLQSWLPNNRKLTISDEQNDESFFRYFTRNRNQDMQLSYSSISRERRKKMLWTAEEEDKLKERDEAALRKLELEKKAAREGVRHFTSLNYKSIPWRNILELGIGVFQEGRTAVDLKDKWKNISKGNQKSK